MTESNLIKNAIILAGGKGTRLTEQTKVIPKPLVRVGPDAAIIHIIRHFVRNGVTNIYIAGGYKFDLLANELKERFDLHSSIIDNDNCMIVTDTEDPIYKANIKIIDTGYDTGTALRIKKVLEYMKSQDQDLTSFITYGDSFSDVDLNLVSNQWKDAKDVATITAVRFVERFGIMTVDKTDNNKVTKFAEKSQSRDEFINGGFIACSADLIDHIEDTDDDFSKDTLPRLQELNRLGAYIHSGFWFAMDSQRDWEEINQIYKKDPENFLIQKERV